ncbi:hypothetical protein CU048_00615 [Beijerinckiaceae bacterium]|nr:hypothetical protein CU048_00615 [Beijerinckiaceae bacterium]
MQKSFQLTIFAWKAVFVLICTILAPSPFVKKAQSEPYASTWTEGQKSSLRLIAAGDGSPGRFYRAGIELRLSPGALTYWRMPGDAGVPPVFSFEGSTNVAGVEVFYPVPLRIDEAGTEAFGYRDRVTFPIHVIPKDANQPSLLVLNLSYAVCERICVPSKAEAKLPLLPDHRGPSAEASAIDAAEATVPLRLPPEERDAKVKIDRDKAASVPTWRVSLQNDALDLFAEGPPGWYFATHKTGRPNEFFIVEVEQPGAETRVPPVTLTVRNEKQSYEFAVELDAISAP